MADYTENYGFKKPARTDRFDIADFNGNMDMIDAAIAQSAGGPQTTPTVPTLLTISTPAPVVETVDYIPPQEWAYDTGQGAVGTTLTVNAQKSGLLVVAVQYGALDSNAISLSGDGWTRTARSGSLMNYFTVMDIYTKPVSAGEHTVTITQNKTGSLFYAHAICLYGAGSIEVIKNAGTSSSSYTYTAEAGTAGKRRLYFLQQGAEKNVLTVKDLPDCGIIDTTYLATIWDIYPADAFSPTFVCSKSQFCYVICEITMKEE